MAVTVVAEMEGGRMRPGECGANDDQRAYHGPRRGRQAEGAKAVEPVDQGVERHVCRDGDLRGGPGLAGEVVGVAVRWRGDAVCRKGPLTKKTPAQRPWPI